MNGTVTPYDEQHHIDFSEMFSDDTYCLRVRGDSLIGDHLCDGDYVIVRRQDNAEDGDHVVAMLHTGETTLRRYYRDGANVRLQTANELWPSRLVPAENLAIHGVVIGVLRSYAK